MSRCRRGRQAAVLVTEVVCLDDPPLNRSSELGGCLLPPATECSSEGSWQGQRREEIHSINYIRILDRKVINRLTYMHAEGLKGGRVKGGERREKGDKYK